MEQEAHMCSVLAGHTQKGSSANKKNLGFPISDSLSLCRSHATTSYSASSALFW